MKQLKIIFLLTILSNSFFAFSQNDSLNRQKYWNFRHRLVTKFVKPGLGPGESIPAKKYSIGIIWANKPANLVKKIEWGDATSHLGWYMAVMATELELLQRSGKTNDAYFQNLIEELYFSLNAINRLDDAAEIVWGYAPDDCETRLDKVEPVLWDSINGGWLPKPGSNDKPIRNGFCLRMDGTADLLKYFTDASIINTGMVRPWVPGDTLSLKPNSLNGGSFGFYGYDTKAPGFQYRSNGYYNSNEVSQDQLFHLSLGLMMVMEFVDEEITYDGVSLKLMAKEIGVRLLDQYKGTEFRNPVHPQRGLCNLGGGSFAFWQSVKKLKRYFETGKKNQVKDQIYFWGKIDCATSYQVNRGLYSIITSLTNTTPQQDLCRYTTGDGFNWGFYTLVRRAIYNPKVSKTGCVFTMEDAKNEMNQCPMRGPHFDIYDYGKEGNYIFDRTNKERNFKEYSKQETIDNRTPLWHFSNRFYQICTPSKANQKRFIVEQGEFNGLDYMLMYNLCHIVFGTDAMGGNYANSREMYFDGRGKVRR